MNERRRNDRHLLAILASECAPWTRIGVMVDKWPYSADALEETLGRLVTAREVEKRGSHYRALPDGEARVTTSQPPRVRSYRDLPGRRRLEALLDDMPKRTNRACSTRHGVSAVFCRELRHVVGLRPYDDLSEIPESYDGTPQDLGSPVNGSLSPKEVRRRRVAKWLVDQAGGRTAREVSDALSMPMTTVHADLRVLEGRGLAKNEGMKPQRNGGRGKRVSWAACV